MRKAVVLGCLLVVLFALKFVAQLALADEGCTIVIEYNHGGFYNKRTQTDSQVANNLMTIVQRKFPACIVNLI